MASLSLEPLEARELPATVFWNVDANGFWDIPANWRDDQGVSRLPGTADDVVIDRPAGSFTVTHRQGTTAVRSLTSQEPVALTFGTLALAESSAFHERFTLQSSATLGGPADVMFHGTLTWQGGTMEGAGTSTIPAGGTATLWNYAMELRGGRQLRNAGTVAWQGPGLLRLYDGSSIHNLEGSTFRSQGMNVVQNSAGTPGSFHNAGTVEVLSGTLGLRLPGSQNGVFDAAANATLDFGLGDWSVPDGARFTGPGLKTFFAPLGTFSLAGTITGENCQFFGGTLAGTFTLSGSFRWSSTTLAGPGLMRLAPESTLELAGPMIINAGRTFENAGAMLMTGQGASVNPFGAGSLFHNLPGATLHSRTNFPAVVYGTNTFRNDGTVYVESGILDLGQSLRNLSGTTLTGGSYLVAGILQFSQGTQIRSNAAALTLDGPAARVIDAVYVNALANFSTNTAAGSFTLLNESTFTYNGDFTNAGLVTVGFGSQLYAVGTYRQTAGRTLLDWGGLLSTFVEVQAGILEGNGYVVGDVTNAGIIRVGGTGASGLLLVIGNYTQTTAGVLEIEIGGLEPLLGYDFLYVSGTATLGGTLRLSRLNDYVPAVDDLFQIMYLTGVNGDFGTLEGLLIGPNRAFQPSRDNAGYYLRTYAI